MTDDEIARGLMGATSRPDIIRPLDGARIPRETAVEIEATVEAPMFAVQHVDFYADGTKIATVTKPPYIATWRASTAGPHELFVRVTDAQHADIPSATTVVTVE